MSKYSKYAYVFLLMKGDRYLPGIIVAAYSLREHQTKQDIVVMVTNDISTKARKDLSIFVDYIYEVPYINCDITLPENYTKTLNDDGKKYLYVHQLIYPLMNVLFTKWNCLKFNMYKKVLFLDADLLPIKNLDHVFTKYPAPSGIMNTINLPNKQKASPKDVKNILLNGTWTFTAGFILLKPGKTIFNKFIKSLNRSGSSKKCKFYRDIDMKLTNSGEDEHAITRFLQNKTWGIIPIIYYSTWKTNAKILEPYTFDDIAVITYMTPIKPWEYKYNKTEYEDVIGYHKVMKEIETKYPNLQLPLNLKPPKSVVKIENLKDKFRKGKLKIRG